MRKSEMIEKLCEPIVVGDVNLHLWPSEAEVILNRIEELGMQPPSYIQEYRAGYLDEFGQEVTDSELIREWEPEDEKK